MTLPADVDTTRWFPNEDRTGTPVGPGDRVLVFAAEFDFRYTIGICKLSEDSWTTVVDERVGRLVVVAPNGLVLRPNRADIYGNSGPEFDRTLAALRKALKEKRARLEDQREQLTEQIHHINRELEMTSEDFERSPR